MRLKILSLLFLSFLTGVSLHARELKFSAHAAPELDALFQNTNGWIGADGSYSIPLTTNQTLWLFSDTWIGDVQNGKRVHPKLINNTIALQRHGEKPQFFYRTNATNGAAESFIKPESGEGFFWLFHGARNQKGLYFFLHRVKTINSSVFGFRTIGSSLAFISNPDDPPLEWKIEQSVVPFEEHSDNEKFMFDSAVLRHDNWFYIYGNMHRKEKKQHGRVVARVPENELGNFDAWRFYSKGQWKKDFHEASLICPEAPSESSVFYEPKLKKFVFLYSRDVKGKIMARTASQPTGPWSEATELFFTPEIKWSDQVISYAGKAHPQLATKPGEWIITYAANSRNFFQVIADARLYWPRFVRVELK